MGSKVNTPFDEFFPSVYKDLLILLPKPCEGKGGFDNYSYSPKTGLLLIYGLLIQPEMTIV